MQKQFRYIYNGKEVNKEEFEKLSEGSFKWFSEKGIESVPFSSFDNFFNGKFKSGRQINDHLDSVLNVYQNKVTEDIINKPKCSTQCFCDGSCKKPQEKKLGGYDKPNVYVNSTRHKAREEGKFHKEPFLVDVSPLGYKDTNRLVEIKLEKKDESHYIPTNATNIEVFHLSTKDNGDKTAFIGFKIENGNFSFVEVPFTSPKVVEKDKSLTEKDDVITSSNRGEKETMGHLQGIKESEGKLNYELDWNFIQQMAERMSQNKDKYEPYNWTKPMNVEKLKQSLFRHVIEVMKGIYLDDGRDFGHFESIALNAMMINYQLKNNV